jgi:hypothetical protein
MRQVIADDRVAGTGQRGDGHLVAHRPGGEKQRSLGPQELCDPLLEPGGRGVLAELLVADLGLGHGPAHALAGKGVSVREEIDHRGDDTRVGCVWWCRLAFRVPQMAPSLTEDDNL